MYKIRLNKTWKCLWPADMVCLLWNEWIFFQRFHKLLSEIPKKIYCISIVFFRCLWRHLWEKLAITVKLSFIETSLKKGYDLRGYFLKLTRETIDVLTIAINIFLNEHLLEAVVRRCSAKKVFLKFNKIYNKKTCACGLELHLKRDCYRCLNFLKLLRTPFLIKQLQWLLLVFSFKLIFPSFYIKMTGL